MATVRLEVSKLNYSYRVGCPILCDLSFETKTGEMLAVLGPNGSGKTTLLKCLLGFLKPDSGKCLLDGRETKEYTARDFFSRVSYVPQAKESVSALKVREMIVLGKAGQIDIFSKPGANDYDRCAELAQRLEITGLLDKKCTELSGGELQMVLIARAMMGEPELLVMDEPESNLDFLNRMIVLDTMSELVKDGIGCIFNTHDPSNAIFRADKALILGRNGEYLFGKSGDIVTEENIGRMFGVHAVIGKAVEDGMEYRSIIPVGRDR